MSRRAVQRTGSLATARTGWGSPVGILDQVATIKAHPRHAQAVCFSADGTRLYSGAFDPAIKIWTVPGSPDGKWRETDQLAGHSRSVNTFALSPDGATLASGSTDRTVRLWDLGTGETKAEFEGHRNTVVGLSWSPDGGHLASCSYDSTVRVWPADSGEGIVLRGHERHAFAVTHTGVEGPLVSGGMDGLLHTWDPINGEELSRVDGPGGVVTSLAWDRGSSRLWALGTEGGVVRYSTVDWTVAPVPGTSDIGLHAMNLSPDGSMVAITGDNTLRLFDAESGSPAAHAELPVKGVYGSGWSPDGSTLAVAGADGLVRIWALNR